MTIVCTICQDLITERPQGLEGSEELIILGMQCGHLFHRKCIGEWFAKSGVPNGQGSCPFCKKTVNMGLALRVYATGDEEGQAVAERLSKAKEREEECRNQKDEMLQLNFIMEDMGSELQQEKMQHETLKLHYAQTLSEIDEMKRLADEQTKLYETQESNWKEIIQKLTGERDSAFAQVRRMEVNASVEKEDMKRYYEQWIANLEEKVESQAASTQVPADNSQKMTVNDNSRNVDIVDASCQTDGRDVAILQARVGSYKSAVRHMESEMKLLEAELGRLKAGGGDDNPTNNEEMDTTFSVKDTDSGVNLELKTADTEVYLNSLLDDSFSDAPVWANQE